MNYLSPRSGRQRTRTVIDVAPCIGNEPAARFAGGNLFSSLPGVPLAEPRSTTGFTLMPASAGILILCFTCDQRQHHHAN